LANVARREEVLAKLGKFFELGKFPGALTCRRGHSPMRAFAFLAGLDFLSGSSICRPVDYGDRKKRGLDNGLETPNKLSGGRQPHQTF